jgi:hypothetical protein
MEPPFFMVLSDALIQRNLRTALILQSGGLTVGYIQQAHDL